MKICTQQTIMYKDSFNCSKCACNPDKCKGKLLSLDNDSSIDQLLTVMQKDKGRFYLPD